MEGVVTMTEKEKELILFANEIERIGNRAVKKAQAEAPLIPLQHANILTNLY